MHKTACDPSIWAILSVCYHFQLTVLEKKDAKRWCCLQNEEYQTQEYIGNIVRVQNPYEPFQYPVHICKTAQGRVLSVACKQGELALQSHLLAPTATRFRVRPRTWSTRTTSTKAIACWISASIDLCILDESQPILPCSVIQMIHLC